METTGGRDRIDRSGSVDSHFNIPKKVIDISKMSSLDRKTLAMRLRSDLVRTRSVLNIIQLRHPNTASHASSSSPSSASPKKQGAPGPSGSRVKGGHTIRFESYKAPPVPASNPEALWMKQCETLLERLMSHKHAWIFSEPVDAVKFKIPDYYDVIKHPMDLGTIKSNIDSGAYKNPWDFAADVRLTFANAMRYNPPHNNVHGMADTMRKLFETRWKPIQKKLCAAVPNFKRETEAAESPVDHNIVVTEKVNQKMTNEEKQNLDSRLMSLSGDLPRDVVNLLWQRSEIENREDQEKEIDIFRLRDDTLFELQKLLDKNLLEKQKIQQVKAE
ncbi:transcription factor GTE11-like [Typha latifolia]|uniref:transcription factor GTE11-like n=1 Tax=Typha latifolia TaxID=4733 RepID=UPI003C2DDDC9